MIEREQFEVWATKKRFDTRRSQCLRDRYLDLYTEFAWEGWKARAELAKSEE